MKQRLTILLTLLFICSIISNIFTPMISHASDFLTNISVQGVYSNNEQAFPAGTTSLNYGEYYGFNLLSKAGIFIKKAVLYIFREEELILNHSYETENNIQYVMKKYQFTKLGKYVYYWVITKGDNQTETTEKTVFTVTQSVILTLSKSDITLPQGGEGKDISVHVNGKGFRDIIYRCEPEGIVSGKWGEWKENERIFTVKPLKAGNATIKMTVLDREGEPIPFASALLYITVEKFNQSADGNEEPNTKEPVKPDNKASLQPAGKGYAKSKAGKSKKHSEKKALKSRHKTKRKKVRIKKVKMIKKRIRGKSKSGAVIKLCYRKKCIRITKAGRNGSFVLKRISLRKYQGKKLIIKAEKKGHKTNVFRFILKYIHF